MSTPMTDAETWTGIGAWDEDNAPLRECVSADFARQLETELQAAQAEVARLNGALHRCHVVNPATDRTPFEEIDQLLARVAELEADKARLIAVVEPHIADLRGTALTIVRAGLYSGLKNTIAEIEKSADELRAAIDAAKGAK